MKADSHNAPGLRAFRSIASVALACGMLVFVWNGIRDRNQTAAQTKAQQGSRLASLWDNAVKQTFTPDTAAHDTRRVHRLEGRFTPGNEAALIEQLARAGYIIFFSYRLNGDGSARIQALHGQQALQPIETISIDKDGYAEAAE